MLANNAAICTGLRLKAGKVSRDPCFNITGLELNWGSHEFQSKRCWVNFPELLALSTLNVVMAASSRLRFAG